jgi:hypothetical protein
MGCVVNATPRPLYSPTGRDRYILYRRLGEPQGWSERVRKIPWTILQTVAERWCIFVNEAKKLI